MVTPLGNAFSTDEQVVAQGDVTYIGKTVESLVMEFDQAKYEEFLSSGSKSPKARVYRKVSSGICSRVRFEILSDATGKKDIMANRIMRNARVNVSQAHTRPEVPFRHSQLSRPSLSTSIQDHSPRYLSRVEPFN